MAIGFAVATAFTLLAVLVGFGYYTTLKQQTAERGMIRQLCAALYPDFTLPESGRDTTQTFRLMLSGMAVFGAVLVVWSVGAGTMRAVWLLSADTVKSTWLPNIKCQADGCDWQVWLFTLFQIVRAIGGVLLICLASGLVGGFFGFLFGIPRRVSADGGTADGKTTDGKTTVDTGAAAAYALSTNLTQVSDWLTKAIIGISLVEAKNAYDGFVGTSATAAGWLFESRHGSPAVVAAALAGGAVSGFLFFISLHAAYSVAADRRGRTGARGNGKGHATPGSKRGGDRPAAGAADPSHCAPERCGRTADSGTVGVGHGVLCHIIVPGARRQPGRQRR
jgi:hypothetical protein